jgi:mannose-1-phosphate guanylyltransferase/mannose-6-phosphate isomerase
MKAVILAGGSGTRLWPLSRKHYPKQFLKIGGEVSLLQATARRLLKAVAPGDLVFMTNEAYEFHVRDDIVEDLGDEAARHIVLEPCSRNTAPALALAAAYCIDELGCGPDEVLFISPSDHVIRPDDEFVAYVNRAVDAAAAGHIVTFGIQPLGPETGYGYIKAGEEAGGGVLAVDGFKEKPDRSTAYEYLSQGGYYWNSGMFAFQAGVFMEELERHAPGIHAIASLGYARAVEEFESMPDISVDFAVMEQSDRVVTMPMDIYWNDVGSWDSFFEVMERDDHGNLRIGDVLCLETRDTLVMSDKRLIATVGLRDLLVVETADAILIARRGDAQEVKNIVQELKKEGRSEAESHLTAYRPWGRYTTFEKGPRYRMKHVFIYPGAGLTRQLHHHRSEHWVVVSGTARILRDGEEVFVHENESCFIPKSTPHLLENPGRVPLEMIEVSIGDYLAEDDIVVVDEDHSP